VTFEINVCNICSPNLNKINIKKKGFFYNFQYKYEKLKYNLHGILRTLLPLRV
jgi:hypothetical protein